MTSRAPREYGAWRATSRSPTRWPGRAPAPTGCTRLPRHRPPFPSPSRHALACPHPPKAGYTAPFRAPTRSRCAWIRYPHGKSVPRAAAPVPPRLPSAPRAGKSPDGGGKHLITREILYSRATSSPSRGPLLPAPGLPGPTPVRFTMHQNRPAEPRKILVHSSADENLRARSLAAGAKNHHRHRT